MDIEWRISTHWEARWIKHQFKLPNDFPYPIHFGITRHLDEYTLNTKQCYIYGLGDQTYNNIAEKRVLMGVKAAQANFVDFFTSEKNVGIETKPDEANTITLWTTYSWVAEPSPIFNDKGVTGVLFEGAE